jgi:isochorismate synthase EntC
MCDNETRDLFAKQTRREWVNTIMLAVLLGVAGWMSLQTFEQGKSQAAYKEKLDNHILEYAELATKIPDGFFSKKRYGESDARHDREINTEARRALDSRIQALERLSSAHIQEAEVWKQTIRDAVTSIHTLEKIVWRQSVEQIDR